MQFGLSVRRAFSPVANIRALLIVGTTTSVVVLSGNAVLSATSSIGVYGEGWTGPIV